MWEALSKLDIKTPAAPGHRIPIYFLANDIDRLRAVMHLHDWQTLLADRRCIIFAGEDTTAQLQQFLIDHPHIAWPRIAVTVDPAVWRPGESLESILAAADAAVAQRTSAVVSRLAHQQQSAPSPSEIAEKFASGAPLRVLGITSLYTTFLQHSMRDWLAGMETLGHTTRLLIEQHDHEKPHPLNYLTAIDEFQPDLIVLIDHYRAELPLMPTHIPCVMWVQDRLPNIFCEKAGAAQGANDFCLGFGRLELSREYGYPKSRYVSAQVGVNERRFSPRALDSDEVRRYTCDVSYVSHASRTAESLLDEQLVAVKTPIAWQMLGRVFDQLKSIYSSGGRIGHASCIRQFIQTALLDLKVQIPLEQERGIYDFFVNKINNALFRHQTVQWLVNLGVDLHLYGNGWELHPTFKRFARGPASNHQQLCAITQASRINLQATPHGAVHQRLFDGLASGGFFLIRFCAGDMADVFHRQLWQWVERTGIGSHDQLVSRLAFSPDAQLIFEQYRRTVEVDLLTYAPDVYGHLELSADGDFIRSAAAIWPEYSLVSFDSEQQLAARLATFLDNPHRRQSIATAMRETVIKRFTYTAVNRRLLTMLASHYTTLGAVKEAA
jgi:hypothetical protein